MKSTISSIKFCSWSFLSAGYPEFWFFIICFICCKCNRLTILRRYKKMKLLLN